MCFDTSICGNCENISRFGMRVSHQPRHDEGGKTRGNMVSSCHSCESGAYPFWSRSLKTACHTAGDSDPTLCVGDALCTAWCESYAEDAELLAGRPADGLPLAVAVARRVLYSCKELCSTGNVCVFR
jgi:hypothetical protein